MMNIQKTKIDLATELINRKGNQNLLKLIQGYMKSMQQDAGKLVKFAMVKKQILSDQLNKFTYALQYENCVIDVELVYNQGTKQHNLFNFDLRN